MYEYIYEQTFGTWSARFINPNPKSPIKKPRNPAKRNILQNCVDFANPRGKGTSPSTPFTATLAYSSSKRRVQPSSFSRSIPIRFVIFVMFVAVRSNVYVLLHADDARDVKLSLVLWVSIRGK